MPNKTCGIFENFTL